MSDPGLITASQLIQSAEARAHCAEVEAKYAKERANKAAQARDELVKELAFLRGDAAPTEARETAERLVSYVYDKFERANWSHFDEDEYDGPPARAVKDLLIYWLAEALEKAKTT